MSHFLAFIETENGEIEKILERLNKSIQEIRDCSHELEQLGFLKIKAGVEEKSAAD